MKSLCQVCRDPGACCRNFPMSLPIPIGSSYAEVERLMRDNEAAAEPWIALGPDPINGKPQEKKNGYEQWRFACRALTIEGRCSVYEERPFACRHYQPLMDDLCIMRAASLTPFESIYAAQPALLPATVPDIEPW